MTRVLGPLMGVVGLMLLPLAAPHAGPLGAPSIARAAGGSPAPTLLTGETFLPGTLTVSGGSGCQPIDVGPSAFSFTASGAAVGPVPGTYTETGTFTIGLDVTNTFATVTQFDASFQVMSGGQVVASGTKTLASPQPLTSFGYCFFSGPNVDAMLDYTATVGNYKLQGQAEASVGPAANSTSPTQLAFQESFESSSTVSCYTSIQMPFNAIPIPGNTWIWFPAIVTVTGNGASSAPTINFTGETLTLDGTGITTNPPSGSTNFSPSAGAAQTVYDDAARTWTTVAPSSIGGKTFLTGVAIKVPPTGLPGGIKPVTWSGYIISDTPGLTIHWQWGAAVYNAFSDPDYNSDFVKPVDDPNASAYQNGDNAGTPEAFKQFVTGGARGGGGNNYTGSWSAVGKCTT